MDDRELSMIVELMAEAGDPGDLDDTRTVSLTSVLLNRGELDAFVMGAAQRFGDPAKVVSLLFVEFRPDFVTRDDMRAGWDRLHERIVVEFRDRGGVHPLSVPVSKDGAEIGPNGPERFHIRKAARGVWALAPSLNIPGQLHAFVVLTNVPDPAPWESLIVVVRG